MRIKIEIPGRKSNRVVVYRASEYSFDVEPQPGGFSSVLINDLHLEVDLGGKIVSIWGLCPHLSWVEADLAPPDAHEGDAYFIENAPTLAGVSVSLNPGNRFPVFFEPGSGWIQIDGGRKPSAAVRLFQNAVLEVDASGQFSSLWIKTDWSKDETCSTRTNVDAPS
jgi:hypothetical protein